MNNNIYIYKVRLYVLRPYHSVHSDQTTFSRCFQNTMYIDIGKYMSSEYLSQ